MSVYVPQDRIGWWGGEDTRTRCFFDDKVIFETEEDARTAADKIRARGDKGMMAYFGKCNHWHVGHSRRRFFNK